MQGTPVCTVFTVRAVGLTFAGGAGDGASVASVSSATGRDGALIRVARFAKELAPSAAPAGGAARARPRRRLPRHARALGISAPRRRKRRRRGPPMGNAKAAPGAAGAGRGRVLARLALFFDVASPPPVVCLGCKSRACPHCAQPAHPGIACADVASEGMRGLCEKDKNTQQCPHCSVLVERISDCDHMTCRCGKNFCIVCGAPSPS